jgi:hypothetical protein
MILHRIRIRNFRGTRDREIRLGPGVTVVEGPNEIGKSSIAEALNLMLEEKATSRKAQVRAIQPVDREAGPEVEAEIATGPYRLVCRKRFLRSAETVLQLQQPRAESLTGDDAHQRLQEILAETLDLDLWKALQIQQGTGIVQAGLADSRSLAAALDAAAGGAGGVDDDGGLFERVRREYERHFQPRQGGERLTPAVEAALEESLRDAGALEDALGRLDEDVRLSERLSREARDLDREAPRLAAELRERERQWADLGRLRSDLERVGERERNADLEAETARRRLEDRQALVSGLEEARARLQRIHSRSQELEVRTRAAVQGLERADAEEGAARALAREAERAALLAEADCLHLRRLREQSVLARRIGRLQELEAAARAARDRLAGSTLDEGAVEELRQAEFALRRARDRLAEGGPRLGLTALDDVELEVDGDRLVLRNGDERSLPVSAPLTLALPGRIRIRVDPGSSLEALQSAREQAGETLDGLLARHGMASVEEAIRLGADLAQARTELQVTEGRIAAEEAGERLGLLQDRMAALEAESSRYLAARPAETDLAASEADAEQLRAAAQAARERARAALEAATTARAGALRERDLAAAELQRALDDTREAEARARSLAERLEATRGETGDEALVLALESAEQRRAGLDRERRLLVRELAELNADKVEALREAGQAAVAENEKARRDNERERVAVRARLEQQQEAGLYERLEQVRARAEHQREELNRLRREAAAIRRLFETLRAERDAARRAYVRPLTERIESLGRILFDPSFAVTLDDDLQIEARTLGGLTVPFQDLSKGTQEQMVILARLAAAMVVGGDEGVPLMLDDTLGYSDPERLRAMGPALARAGRSGQLIILTCTPERFRYIPGASVQRLTAADG